MDDVIAPGTRLGPFEIEALIGAGGMGRVYRARDSRLGRSVAIYRGDPSTGRQESWKNIFPRKRAGIMLMVTFRATRDGRTQAYSWHRALSNLYVAEGLA
jgi:serine/threonine protein kinase